MPQPKVYVTKRLKYLCELELRRRGVVRAPLLLPHQVPPTGQWLRWILLSGRGGGKTYAAAYYVDQYAKGNPDARIAVIAPTLGDARKTCVEGVTGLLHFNPGLKFNRGWGEVSWPNGARASLFGAHTPDDAERLRGPQHHLGWFEEFAAARQLEESWSNFLFGLRLGARPHTIITTTPKPRPLLKALLADPNTVVTRATTNDNPYLHDSVKEELYRLYGGTRKGLQELEGRVLEDNPHALWNRSMLDNNRVHVMPQLERVVVAVDPSATSTGDACGIVVAGIANGHGYVLDDLTRQASPMEWAGEVVAAYHKWRADKVVAETNQGGEMVKTTIASVDPTIPYKGIHASRGKVTRAEPVASLYEQNRVHHVGTFPELEDELTDWEPGGASPNRLDALVHGLTELLINTKKVIHLTAR